MSKPGAIEVSVIIPALAATPHALRMATLLAEQEQDFPFEVLLVLNHEERRIEVELPDRVRILFCLTPGSYAVRNTGIAAAQGRVIAFMDSDVVPHAHWLSEGYIASKTLDFRAMVAGAVKPYHERRTAAGVYEGAFYYRQDEYVKAGFAGPANFWVPRTLIDTVGAFDESLFAASSHDFCWRAIAADYGLAFSEQAVVYHPTRTSFLDLMRREKRAAGAHVLLQRRGLIGRRAAPGLGEEARTYMFRRRYLAQFYPGSAALQGIALASFAVRFAERLRVMAGGRPVAH